MIDENKIYQGNCKRCAELSAMQDRIGELEHKIEVLELALADIAHDWFIANSKRGDWGLTYTAEEYAEKAIHKAEALTKKEANNAKR